VADNNNQNKDQFFHPQAKYQGEFSPEALAFNANLQEFASRVGIICNLETGGKISSEEAYKEIKQLWKQLKQSKHELLDTPRPSSPDLPSNE
jgi:cephalosporin-C deacetylase-like acetyl esterase